MATLRTELDALETPQTWSFIDVSNIVLLNVAL